MPAIRRLTALVLATALMLASAIGFIEIVAAALDQPAWIVPGGAWATWLSDHSWNDGPVRVALSGVLLLGLLLLVVGLYPGRRTELALASTEPGVTVAVSRRGVERTLAAAAHSIPGVTSVKASARRRRVRVDAWTRIRDTGDLRERISAAVQEHIDALALDAPPPHPSVRIHTKEI
jgi:hypothetical protein